ncbi:MAG: CehA/McbA family metallohydrolase [Gemmatimonadetes bacterium]|nr:CehA/McbA family metallohydrolase [Gemmatimonadota bacterium]
MSLRPRQIAIRLALVALVSSLAPAVALGQWSNRYPKVEGYNHHVYLEGYELPFLTEGPIDPAPAPDGARVAFAARGWIWILDLATGTATRLTRGAEVDSRPAWSPDGRLLAFVRDDGSDTQIVIANAASGAELGTIGTERLELDPVFSPDGSRLFFSSAVEGDLDLWSVTVDGGARTRLTTDRGIELRPQPSAEGLLYLAKRGSDRVEWLPASGGPPVTILEGRIASMARPALSPDGSTVAVNWPGEDGWGLRLALLDEPGPSILLRGGGLPLTPAWDPTGEWIYFAEADADERVRLRRIRAVGGEAEDVPVRTWDWGEPTATLRVRTTLEPGGAPVPARLNAIDRDGHPALATGSVPRFDGQNGRVFFYSPGVVELTLPVGSATVAAVRGLATPEATRTVELVPQYVTEVELVLEPVWDARANGWISGEHHFHLNYGGLYDLSPSDLIPMMEGEALDVATPLLANLHNRFEDQDLWGWRTSDRTPLIRFGQEIRSHFLGHLGLIGIDRLFWPWVWGPGYQVYGADDRENAEALEHARGQGGIGYYVHPVTPRGVERATPWEEASWEQLASSIPIELIADAVLGDLDALEVVCLWSDEVSTAAVWHRLLNVGVPIAPSAGTDVMTDFYRTMAVGTARVYAHTGGALSWPAYLSALAEGRSFVTNGPMLDFRIGGAMPGGSVPSGNATWSLDLASANAVERVEVLVNGDVVWSAEGPAGSGSARHAGELELPEGGWVAARAVGGPAAWPAMANYPFAHTGPVWIGERGSTDAAAARAAATDLLIALERARARLEVGYGAASIPKLTARFDRAEAWLRARAEP